jgi:hypothetical protein
LLEFFDAFAERISLNDGLVRLRDNRRNFRFFNGLNRGLGRFKLAQELEQRIEIGGIGG